MTEASSDGSAWDHGTSRHIKYSADQVGALRWQLHELRTPVSLDGRRRNDTCVHEHRVRCYVVCCSHKAAGVLSDRLRWISAPHEFKTYAR